MLPLLSEIEKALESITLGTKPVTYALQLSMDEPELVKVVIVIASTGWFVGGELKLLIENEIVWAAERVELTTLDTRTRALETDPMHCIPVLTF